ncbi:MAG: hypothetical protein ACLP25_23810, partial [Roseiarcus sp.]
LQITAVHRSMDSDIPPRGKGQEARGWVIAGDNLAMMAFRERTLPFPDGAIIAAIPRNYVSSEENNKIFGHDSGQQSRGPEPRSWT